MSQLNRTRLTCLNVNASTFPTGPRALSLFASNAIFRFALFAMTTTGPDELDASRIRCEHVGILVAVHDAIR